MNDVAKEAGVSRGTVSNYLNNRRVRPEAKRNIEMAIEKLGYVRNVAARDLRTQSSKYVVFILPTVWTPFFSELTYCVQRELKVFDYKMILCISNNNFADEKEYAEMAMAQKVAGIISISYSQFNEQISTNIPLVSIEKEPTGKFPLVSSDNFTGGNIAASELYKRGATQLYYIGPRQLKEEAMKSRKMGFIDFCEKNSVKHQEYGISFTSSNGQYREEIDSIISQLIENSSLKNSGIFAGTDEYASAVLDSLLKKNIDVPKDVQVIGFDGSMISENDRPKISSIRQPVQKIAKVAVDELNKIIIKKKIGEKDRIVLPVTFKKGITTR